MKLSSFRLKDGKADKPTSIILYVPVDDNPEHRVKITTGELIHPRDFSDGAFVINKNNRRSVEPIAARAMEKKKIADDYLTRCNLDKIPVCGDDVKRLFNDIKAADGEVSTNDIFFKNYARFYALIESGDVVNEKGLQYSSGQLKVYRLLKTNLTTFAEHNNIDPSALTPDVVQKFRVFMIKKNASKNYIGKQVKTWKSALKIMHGQKMHYSKIYNDECFRAEKETVQRPALSEQEIETIFDFKCRTETQTAIRDRWMIMYCLGIRVGDCLNLKLQHIKGDKITLMNQKTGELVQVPAHEMLIEILERHNGLPRSFDEQIINREIKFIAAECIKGDFTYKVTRGGKQIEITVPKWQLITNHTGRRSLVTNMIRNGINYETGGGIVGMSRPIWDHYNKLSIGDRIDAVKDNPVFKKKSTTTAQGSKVVKLKKRAS